MCDDVRGQARWLRPEEKRVRFAIGDVGEAIGCVAREGEDARIGQGLHECVEIAVDSKVCEVVVIQARAFEVGVFEGEAEGFDEVECGPRACCKPDRRPRVSGNSRFIENDVKHQLRVPE